MNERKKAVGLWQNENHTKKNKGENNIKFFTVAHTQGWEFSQKSLVKIMTICS
jgi:hypothetical protein